MIKRVISFFLSMALIFSLMPISTVASAGDSTSTTVEEETTAPVVEEQDAADVVPAAADNTCGENLSWSLEDSVLTVSGTGAMTDYSAGDPAPWFGLEDDIYGVVLETGVTSIGDYAFHGCRSLVEIQLPDTLETIGEYAFYSCNALTQITVPSGVCSIGARAFAWCTSLTEVYFEGNAPVIASNAFHYVTAEAYYSEDNATWTDEIMLDYSGTIAWVPYEVEEEEDKTLFAHGPISAVSYMISATCL